MTNWTLLSQEKRTYERIWIRMRQRIIDGIAGIIGWIVALFIMASVVSVFVAIAAFFVAMFIRLVMMML